jgi:prolyl-tRNA synthetase
VRWSKSFLPTLRDDPSDAEAVSHKLLTRAGFMRQLMAGSYSLLPLGYRVAEKITAIVRDEMRELGGQEFRLPTLHPREIWDRSGRWDTMGSEMFRFKDRRGADVGLGMTAEEVFAHLASELRSYKQLPQTWYQIHTKYRDEARPKSGLLRVREFTMKDSYSLDIDEAGLDHSFDQHFKAYRKIFKLIGFDPIAVEASSGAMGGSQSVEFMLRSDAGEDWIASCEACGYAANVEKATSQLTAMEDAAGLDAPEEFATPGVRTIADLETFEGGAPSASQIKTLVYIIDGKPVLLLLRGDDSLSEQKLIDSVEAEEMRPANPDEIKAALGALPGSLGAVGVTDHFVIGDEALQGRTNMTTGANKDEVHLRGVSVERDLDVKAWLDLREVKDGEACIQCSKPLSIYKTIEVAHIFKLGTKYSEAMGATVLDQNGKARPVIMGSYGIGIERALAAVAEACHDDDGILWPVNVAPFEVVITVVKPKNVECMEVGERIYDALIGAGIDVLLDDRDERPGVKFKDADLIGFPYRVTVGPKGIADGNVEIRSRRDGEVTDELIDRAAENIIDTVLAERR